MTQSRARPITLAILAMGGEGGGVLADWLVALAQGEGYRCQMTSVPGVAQRTGATIYYLEMFAPPGSSGTSAPSQNTINREPVLALMPAPGDVDVVVASELMEAGRAVQRGLVTPDKTTLIASTHRVYSMTEKMAMGDGRVDAAQLQQAITVAARRLVAADFAELARAHATVISAPLFGAIAGSGALPFTRTAFEKTIDASGVGVKASRAAFAAAFERAAANDPVAASDSVSGSDAMVVPAPAAAKHGTQASPALARLGPQLLAQATRIREHFPPAAHDVLAHGVLRLADYQDVAYAQSYLDRLMPLVNIDDGPQALLVNETARHLALWMSYEDTIRVADLKTRATRFSRVASEQGVLPGQLLEIREFLHPRVEEIADTLPAALGRALLASGWPRAWLAGRTRAGRIVQTHTLRGFLLLYTVAGLRRWRRGTLRFANETAQIENWLRLVLLTAGRNRALAIELARLQRLVKGYGDTHSRGSSNFNRIVARLTEIEALADPAQGLRSLADAALADDAGRALDLAFERLLGASAVPR